jgi:GntR family transcriptional regulator
VQRVSYSSDGRAIEAGDDHYLPDAMSFQMQVSLQGSSLTRHPG